MNWGFLSVAKATIDLFFYVDKNLIIYWVRSINMSTRRNGVYIGEDECDHIQLRRPRPGKAHPAIRRSLTFVTSLLLLRPPTKHGPKQKQSEENLSRGSSSSPRFGMFLTLKVLFWDIAISLGDTVTDFAQAYALMADGKWSYGAVTLAINWIPGEF